MIGSFINNIRLHYIRMNVYRKGMASSTGNNIKIKNENKGPLNSTELNTKKKEEIELVPQFVKF
jgi:hypothetical protein